MDDITYCRRSTHHDVTMTVEYTVDGVLYQKVFKVGNPIDGFTIFIIMLVGVLVFLKGTEQS